MAFVFDSVGNSIEYEHQTSNKCGKKFNTWRILNFQALHKESKEKEMIGIHRNKKQGTAFACMWAKICLFWLEKASVNEEMKIFFWCCNRILAVFWANFLIFFFTRSFISSKNVKKNWIFIYDPIFSCSIFSYLLFYFLSDAAPLKFISIRSSFLFSVVSNQLIAHIIR